MDKLAPTFKTLRDAAITVYKLNEEFNKHKISLMQNLKQAIPSHPFINIQSLTKQDKLKLFRDNTHCKFIGVFANIHSFDLSVFLCSAMFWRNSYTTTGIQFDPYNDCYLQNASMILKMEGSYLFNIKEDVEWQLPIAREDIDNLIYVSWIGDTGISKIVSEGINNYLKSMQEKDNK
jgi:hypothetical protein